MTEIDWTMSGVETGLEFATVLTLRLRVFSHVMRVGSMTKQGWNKSNDVNRLDSIGAAREDQDKPPAVAKEAEEATEVRVHGPPQSHSSPCYRHV